MVENHVAPRGVGQILSKVRVCQYLCADIDNQNDKGRLPLSALVD